MVSGSSTQGARRLALVMQVIVTLQGFQEIILALKQAFYLCQLSVGDSTLPPFCVFRPGGTFLQHGESRQGKDDHIFVLPAVEGNRVGLSRREILGDLRVLFIYLFSVSHLSLCWSCILYFSVAFYSD